MIKRLLVLAVASVVFFCSQVAAQAGVPVILMNVTDKTSTQTGSAVDIGQMRLNHMVCRVTATEDSGTATVSVRVDHSPDATTYATLLTFTTLSATGGEDVHVNQLNTAVYPKLRAVATVTGTGQWDIKVVCFGDGE